MLALRDILFVTLCLITGCWCVPVSNSSDLSANNNTGADNHTTQEHGFHWTYGVEGEKEWKREYHPCEGRHQSPIDIDTTKVRYEPNLGTVSLYGYDEKPDTMKLKNIGHTVQVDVGEGLYLEGGGLTTTYKLLQLHFHWKSEHTVNGARFPMEVHFVHQAVKMPSIDEAVRADRGLAVLGFLFELSLSDNPALEPIIKGLEYIQYNGQDTMIDPFPVMSMLPKYMGKFYRYDGGLTTPPCFESVHWTVFTVPMQISQTQLNKFMLCSSNTHAEASTNGWAKQMKDIYRTVQPMNDRIVLTNDEKYAPKINPATGMSFFPNDNNSSSSKKIVVSFSLLTLSLLFAHVRTF